MRRDIFLGNCSCISKKNFYVGSYVENGIFLSRSHLRGQRYLAIVRIGGPVLLRRKGSQASMDRVRDLYGEY